MADSNFGLTASGFVPMALTDVQADLESRLIAAFGPRINVKSGNFAILVGILAERHALLWQLAQGIYASQYPAGASGLAVDNILALAGMTRLSAKASTTAPTPATQTSGIPLFGLVLYGTPGTVIPAGSLISDGTAGAVNFALDQSATIGAAQNAQQLIAFSSTPASGSYALALSSASGATATTAPIPAGAQLHDVTVTFNSNAANTDLTVSLDGAACPTLLDASDGIAGVTAALQSLSGYAQTSVSAVSGNSNAYTVSFAGHIPVMTFDTSPASASAAHPFAVVTQSVQGFINTAKDPNTGLLPYSDVAVTTGPNGYKLNFGAFSPPSGQTSSGAQAQAKAAFVSNTLPQTSNPSATVLVAGTPAQAIGSATAVATGPIAVGTGSLNNIVTPISGWSAVTNQLDVVTGQNLETDAAAIARFQTARQSQGSASVGAIQTKLSALSGVTTAKVFQNNTDAALQLITFSTPPTAGAYALVVNGVQTASINAGGSASAVQAAIQGVSGYNLTQVTGSQSYGFTVDFAGSNGGQPQPLLGVGANTTATTISVTYGRPPHSLEAVVQGGADADVASALLASAPAGIGLYGAPAAITTAGIWMGSYQIGVISAKGVLVGQAVQMAGVTKGAIVTGVNGTTININTPAFATVSNVTCVFLSEVAVTDAAGNQQLVQFSRPQIQLLYAQITITTDTYNTPGVASSGINPNAKWSPGLVADIQNAVCAAANNTPLGGTVIARGTGGVADTLGGIAGIYDVSSFCFDFTPNPTNTGNLSLSPNAIVLAEPINIAVSTS